MRVLKSASGNHDERVSGEGVTAPSPSNPGGTIRWTGGEIIYVPPDLAASFEASGMAERVLEPKMPDASSVEAAVLTTPETAVMPAVKKRVRGESQ